MYFSVKSSFWFVPGLITLAALIAAPLSLQADFAIGRDVLTNWLPGPQITQEGARMVLSTVAGSMMTVASLVFSMTLLALSLVSQQLGPRVLQFFMEDGATKVVLGAFIATFLFALIVLGTVGSGQSGEFVPRLSVFLTGVFAIIAFVLVIYFVHHISTQIQADVIVAKLGQQLTAAVTDLLENRSGGVELLSHAEYKELDDIDEDQARTITSNDAGYVASIDEMTCLAVATEHDLRVRMNCRPGHFVLENEPILHAEPRDNIDDKVADALRAVFGIQTRRTREQHVEFEMNALVEVALRALSAGINDPYTAMACIDRLVEGMVLLLSSGPDLRVLRSEEGVVRVFLYPQEYEHFMNTAFHPIRQAAKTQPQVLLHLLGAIRELATFTQTEQQRTAIAQHVDAIEQSCKQHLTVEHDLALLQETVNRTRAAL